MVPYGKWVERFSRYGFEWLFFFPGGHSRIFLKKKEEPKSYWWTVGSGNWEDSREGIASTLSEAKEQAEEILMEIILGFSLELDRKDVDVEGLSLSEIVRMLELTEKLR